MWIPVSTIAALCVLFDASDTTRGENNLELIFQERSKTDWQNAWHQEKHVRCRDTLIRHLYWACEKDIYRITRRSDTNNINDYDEEEMYPWLTPQKAKKFLRFRRSIDRRSRHSITTECCKSTGCTWEEYAEYCPTNKRYYI